MSPQERIHLAGTFIRHGLRMQGLADAVAAETADDSLGARLKLQVKQLRFRSRDVGDGKLEPSDLALLLADIRESLGNLCTCNTPVGLTKQLGRECSCLEDLLSVHGLVPR